MPIQVRISTPDLRSTLRAFEKLERDARDVAVDAGQEAGDELAALIRAFAGTRGRQAARAAETVEADGPKVTAGTGGSEHARDLVLGSEFGATRRFGWYRKGRYYNSSGKQFPPHRGSDSYWFFRTYEANRERVIEKYSDKLDAIARDWGTGG